MEVEVAAAGARIIIIITTSHTVSLGGTMLPTRSTDEPKSESRTTRSVITQVMGGKWSGRAINFFFVAFLHVL